MIKRILICILFFACCPTVFAGSLFNVSSNGPAAQISMTLCLNGQGPISCQTYTTSATNLNITTAIPNHTYPNAGIKINTPGYLPAGCSPNSNGYCLFSVSNTTAAAITATPSTCQSYADLIVFSPGATYVNNPTGGTPNHSQQFTINMTMCNSLGQPLIPSANNPIHVDIYGAPNGVISRTSTTSSTGAVTLTYSGQTFPNNILINAWISDSTNNGVALGQTQVLQQNPLPCSYAPTSFTVPLTQALPNALQIKADVGYSASSPINTLADYTIDTGSLGILVPFSDLPQNANVIGPGPVGVTYYDSSGNTFSGNYYLAPVRIQTNTGTVMTQPIMVLVINKSYCSGPSTLSCYTDGAPPPTLHYMGVGFNRAGASATNPLDLFSSPTANAFLHVTDANNGTDVTPGYYLTPNNPPPTTPPTAGLTLGISSVANYSLINLTPNTAVPGDFLTESGCFNFTGSGTPQFCGTVLLDVGIDYMIMQLPKAQWIAGTHEFNSAQQIEVVKVGTPMSIFFGNPTALQYSFTAIQQFAQDCAGDSGANNVAPCYAQLIDSTATGQIFVNTGRRPLYQYDYLYQGQCGQVGFYKF